MKGLRKSYVDTYNGFFILRLGVVSVNSDTGLLYKVNRYVSVSGLRLRFTKIADLININTFFLTGFNKANIS